MSSLSKKNKNIMPPTNYTKLSGTRKKEKNYEVDREIPGRI